MSEKIKAPFTKEQVNILNKYQELEYFHPFTCKCSGSVKLIATTEGWICKICDNTQDWAHDFMADPEFVSRKPDSCIN